MKRIVVTPSSSGARIEVTPVDEGGGAVPTDGAVMLVNGYPGPIVILDAEDIGAATQANIDAALGDLAAVSFSGSYNDLISRPTLGTAASTNSDAYDPAGSATTARNFAIQRANHTGTQPASTIADLAETIRDTIGATLVEGAGIDIVVDDAANTITLTSTATGGISQDDLDDAIAALAQVARTGVYADLTGKPTLGTAAAQPSTAFASAAQGSLAASAVQPDDLADIATTGDYNDLINVPSSGGLVSSVNEQVGEVVLDAADVGADPVGSAAAAQAAAVQRANHTGTQAQSTISDLVADLAAKQPLDSDLTAIAALSTTTYGRSLLTQADAAATRTAMGLGSISTLSTIVSSNITDGTIVNADINASAAIDQSKISGLSASLAGLQPLDSDLTAIAALTTTSYGRSFLALADAASGRTLLGLGTAATSDSTAFQPVDSDLTAIAALSTTTFGRSLLTAANAAGGRTLLGLGSISTLSTITSSNITDGTIVDVDINASAAIAQSKISGLTAALAALQPLDSDLTAIAALTTTTYGRAFLALADAAAARTALGLGTAATTASTAYATAAQGTKADAAVQSDGTVTHNYKLTQAAYDLLTPSSTAVYFIVEP